MRLRSAFLVRGSKVLLFNADLFAFRISGFQCPPGHADVTDTSGR